MVHVPSYSGSNIHMASLNWNALPSLPSVSFRLKPLETLQTNCHNPKSRAGPWGLALIVQPAPSVFCFSGCVHGSKGDLRAHLNKTPNVLVLGSSEYYFAYFRLFRCVLPLSVFCDSSVSPQCLSSRSTLIDPFSFKIITWHSRIFCTQSS